MNANRLFPALCLTLSGFLAACGGEAPAAGDAEPVIDSTIITDLPREPLTEEDLDGMALVDLSVELPWTQNTVSRDPAPAAARATVEETQSRVGDSYDRVTFTFSASTPFPGYEIHIADADTPMTCGDEDHQIETEAARLLVVSLRPARRQGDGWQTGRRSQLGGERFTDAGIVCDDGRTVTWVAGLAAGEEVRVLEFRNPQRLVVDLR